MKRQQVDIMSMKMHRYINVTQYFRITTRHGIAGIIVGFDGVVSICIIQLHKRSSGFQEPFVTTFLTSYQLHDSIKHSKRTLRTEFENKYSH